MKHTLALTAALPAFAAAGVWIVILTWRAMLVNVLLAFH